MAVRNALGNPLGFKAIANAETLEISLSVERQELNESFSGQRQLMAAFDSKKSMQVKAVFTSYNPDVLDLGTRGETTTTAAGTSVAWSATAYKGMIVPLGHPSVSSLTVTTPGAAATTFATTAAVALNDLIKPTTPNGRYYKVVTAGTTAGTEPTWPTNGTTVTSGTAVLKDMGVVAPVLGTDYTVNSEWGSLNILTAGGLVDEAPISGTLSHGAYSTTQAFTKSEPIRWLRFEGLNTSEEGSPPVTVDIFKVGVQPLASLSLITNEFGKAEVTMTAYLDETKTGEGTSQFFTVTQQAA